MKFISDPAEREEVRAYMERFKDVSAEEKLRMLGEMRNFMWKCMSLEGRREFIRERGFDPDDYDLETCARK